VVENDVGRPSKPIIDEFRRRGLPIIYCSEPEQNISLARNRAVKQSDAEWIATIDDDAVADPQWLQMLLDAAAKYQADGVFGTAERRLPSDAPSYLVESQVFGLDHRPATGSTRDLPFNTINALFQRRLIAHRTEPFDRKFGLTGGEDTNLFFQLQNEGARFVWCNEAAVVEYVLPDRVNLLWVLRRAFREGGTYFRVYRRWNIAPDKPLALRFIHLGIWSTRITLQIALGGACGLFRNRSRNRALINLRELFRNIGIAAQTFGISYEEYRDA